MPPAGDVAAALAALDHAAAVRPPVDHVSLARLEDLAERARRPDLRMRARLLWADDALRGGDAVAAATGAHRVNAWAQANGDDYLLARSHHLLAAVFGGVGDDAEALAQSVQAVARTPVQARPWVRSLHLAALGAGLIGNASVEPARRRFAEALALADGSGDHELQVIVLNGIAAGLFRIGDLDGARGYAARMLQLQRRHGVALCSTHLDTLARIEVASGRYADAEDVLEPAVRAPVSPLHTDVDSYPRCLLTLAEARRGRGDVVRAQVALDRCREVAAERGLDHLTARVMREQARLHAAGDRYREAYQELERFQDVSMRLLDSRREVRAAVAHAVLEVEETRRDRDQFRELASRDPLTGVHNRRLLDDRLPELIARAERSGAAFSVALLDLDHFKRVNDTCSHEIGDLVLQQVTRVTAGTLPPGASLVRMGGEEFLVLLPDCDADAALAQAERIRRVIQDVNWSALTGHLPVTASIGVATCAGPGTASGLLAEVDRYLYAAKRAGRNRVVGPRTPDRAVPGQVVQGQAVPGQVVQGQAAQAQAVQGQAVRRREPVSGQTPTVS